MTKEKKKTKCDDLIDTLLEKHGISPEAVLGENGLIAQLKKRVVERALAGEPTHPLGYAKGEAPEEVENRRNGYSKKTVVGEGRDGDQHDRFGGDATLSASFKPSCSSSSANIERFTNATPKSTDSRLLRTGALNINSSRIAPRSLFDYQCEALDPGKRWPQITRKLISQ
jgi:hypothetical protein